ncbi:sialate O-acetylesterase [Lutibacter agarilyticus]|uniref:Sialate O-acetylesterase n=1 Tax=Lutibacter agarilyticus TaxID=1109740 RepID=A0A238X6L3_9FLAO|nr:sialate O-acetylesterase [Lutibacter agarilyticus]SNR54340.1 sialate O-acetylesterase [Lutibacter agarilyticus]
MKFLKLFFTVILFSCSSQLLRAEVSLADIFSDHMVLQRNMDLKIWGTADSEEELTLSFNGQNVKTKANNKGEWSLVLKPMSEGGPFVMTVEGKNKVVLKDILIGDVWVCSGQSNMGWTVKQSNNAEEEISNAKYPNIRLFSVPHNVSNIPLTEIPNRSWQICSPQTIRDFTAVGYFFGRNLHLEIGVPIGLINSSYGGTCVETWTSKESIAKLPNYEGFDKKIEAFDIEEERNKKRNKLRSVLGELPKNETGMADKWMLPDTDRSDWSSMQLPNEWENQGYGDLDGVVWFSHDVDLNFDNTADKIELHLGIIDDSDIVWVNGVKVGETNWGFNTKRIYSIPQEAIKSGKNNITIRVQDRRNKGGFLAPKTDFYINLGNDKVSLSGKWKFKVDKVYDNFDISPNAQPSLLYNAMIHPLIPYGIKGVIWYQGENNAPRGMEYRITFPNMINNWRQDWKQGDFPFLFVQLANFGAPNNMPSNSNWAELRESQTKALKLENTGMALAIDLGEAFNIHPKNKQDVGERLALAVQKIAYNKNIVHSGPQYKSIKIKGNKAIISFDYVGSGLEVKNKNDQLKEFEIAGKDQRFYKAVAKIEGDNIIVWSEKVSNPVAVRFAWANNPAEFNFYNKEGLPALPFRTDDWKGVTDGKSFDNL